MRIAAVNTFLAPNFSALKNNKSSNNTQNTNNDYQLPNYKLSFGMSKAAINRRHSGLNYETKEEIQNAAKEMTSPRYGTEDVYNRMDMLVKKFNDDKDALKYIFECSDIKDTPVGANLAVAYLWALRDNRDEQEWANGEWKRFFTSVLCDTKNQTGQTIPQIFANNALVLYLIDVSLRSKTGSGRARPGCKSFHLKDYKHCYSCCKLHVHLMRCRHHPCL